MGPHPQVRCGLGRQYLDDPCHFDVYRGDGPASEPETRNVIQLLDSRSEIRWMVDIHSHVPAVFHVWGSDEPQTTDPSMSFRNPEFDSGARPQG